MRGLRFTSPMMAVTVATIAAVVGCTNGRPTAPSQVKAAVQTGSESISAADHESLSAATLQELAEARDATAKYHDVQQALADGYVQKVFRAGEGIHFVKASLMDCTFDLAHPETLLYVPSDDGLRLVGVEYSVLSSCTSTAPEGFTGDADEWEPNAEGRPVWGLIAWLWIGNPNGVFAEPPNPVIH
jgi:hypothetical protein